MPVKEQYVKIDQFKGLGSPYIFSGDPRRVRDMVNVRSQFGRIIGRDGYTVLGNDPANIPVMGMYDFKSYTDDTVTLVRVEADGTAGRARKLVGSTWTDIGAVDARTTTAPNYVDFQMHSNVLWFIYPGSSDPVKWTGSGNVAEVAAGPTGRFLASFGGRILVGYASGGLSDPQCVAYDDADNGTTWTGTNRLNCRETPGAIQRMLPLAKALYVYKTDGATILRFVGSTLTIFSQERAPMSVGVLASGSVANIPAVGHILLGSDGRLHVNDGAIVQPVLTDLNNTLAEDLNMTAASTSMAGLDIANNVYTLMYPGGTSALLNKRLEFNYLTGEFAVFEYSTGFTKMAYSQYAGNNLNNPTYDLVASRTDKTYLLDDGLTDDGEAISYEWQSDWIDLGQPMTKYITKIDLVLDSVSTGSVDLSLATDFNAEWTPLGQQRIATVRGMRDVVVRYNIPKNQLHQLFNLRVRFMPRTLGSDIVLKAILVYFAMVEGPTPEIRQER